MQQAQASGTLVRWLNWAIGNTMIIAEPEEEERDGWIRLEIITPFSR